MALKLKVFRFWRSKRGPGSMLKAMLQRSFFHTVSVKQIQAAYEETGFAPNPDLDALFRDKATGCISSDIVEHIHNASKNHKKAVGAPRKRKPQIALAAAIAKRVGTERYKYIAPDVDVPLKRKSVALPPADFGMAPPNPTINLKGICSTQPKAPWFSPGPENFGIAGADVQVLEDAFLANDPRIIENSFMSCAFNYRHRMIVRRVGGVESDFQWVYPLWHYSGSAGFGWPVSIRPVPGYVNHAYVEFDGSITTIAPIAVSDWRHITAKRVQFHSVAYQAEHFPMARFPPALRLFVESEELPLIDIAVAAGFWDLDATTLGKVASVLGYDVSQETSLMRKLFALTKSITNKSDAAVMKHVASRLKSFGGEDLECTEILMNIDEAASCLLRDEIESLEKEKKSSVSRIDASQAFHDEFHAKMKDVGNGNALYRIVSRPSIMGEPVASYVVNQKGAKI